MRLLLDENLSAHVVPLLALAGHDAIHIGDVGMLGAADTDVLSAAAEQDRILVTADADFGAILALSGLSRPSVLLLRGPGRTPAVRARQVIDAVEAAGEVLESGALVVRDGSRIRIRDLPIRE